VATPNPTHGAQSKPPALAQTVLSSDFKEQPTPTGTHPQPGHPCLSLASPPTGRSGEATCKLSGRPERVNPADPLSAVTLVTPSPAAGTHRSDLR